MRLQSSSSAILLLLCLLSCGGRNPGDPLEPGFNSYSKEQDIQLGREAAAQVRKQLPIVEDKFLQSYLDRVGRLLASQPAATDFPYTFEMVNDKNINAFALPGGPIFANSGLLIHGDNEAQFAGVIAHEIGHVALRHGTNQASKASLIQLPAAIAGAVAGSGGSALGQLAQLGIGIGANSVLLKYSRDAEREADALGARIMASAGYNPIEMARFFEKMAAEGDGGGPTFLSSHPDPGNRMELVQQEIRVLPAKAQYNASTGDFAEAKKRAQQLPEPRGGYRTLQSNAQPPNAPSGGVRQVQTRYYSMAAPAGWEVFGDPNAGAVTIAPRQGLVQNVGGGTSVGYGIIASYYSPRGRRMNLRQGTSNLLYELAQGNPGLQASGAQRTANVGGSPALITTLRNQSPFRGVEETDYLVTVARPQGMFYMLFIAPSRDMPQLQSLFEQMLGSLRFN